MGVFGLVFFETQHHMKEIAVALVFVLAVTVTLVVARSFSAATKNPVESIKAE